MGSVALLRQQGDDGGRDVAAVCDRDLGPGHVERPCAVESLAVEGKQRLASRVTPDFDVAKRESPPSQTEGLHGRLLGRETAGHVLGEGTGMATLTADLTRTKHPLEKALAMAL